MLADKTSVESTQCGEVILSFESANLDFEEARVVPKSPYNLFCTGRFG